MAVSSAEFLLKVKTKEGKLFIIAVLSLFIFYKFGSK